MFRSAVATALLRRPRHQPRRRFHEDSSGARFAAFSVTQPPSADPRFGMDLTSAPGYEVAAEDDAPLVGDAKLADFASRHAGLPAESLFAAPGYIWLGNILYPSDGASHDDLLFSWEASAATADQHPDDDVLPDPPADERDAARHAAPADDGEDPALGDGAARADAAKTATQAGADAAATAAEVSDVAASKTAATAKATPTLTAMAPPKGGAEGGAHAKRRYTGGQARRIRKEREKMRERAARKLRERPQRPMRKPHNDVPDEEQSS